MFWISVPSLGLLDAFFSEGDRNSEAAGYESQGLIVETWDE